MPTSESLAISLFPVARNRSKSVSLASSVDLIAVKTPAVILIPGATVEDIVLLRSIHISSLRLLLFIWSHVLIVARGFHVSGPQKKRMASHSSRGTAHGFHVRRPPQKNWQMKATPTNAVLSTPAKPTMANSSCAVLILWRLYSRLHVSVWFFMIMCDLLV